MRKPNIRQTWEEVTPEKAMEWLNKSDALHEKGFIQRSLQRDLIRQLADQITDGKFRGDNGLTIGLSSRGAVVNGQNRLHAVVRARKSIWIFVQRGVGEDTFSTIDIGKTRTAATLASHAGHKHAALATAAAKLLICYSNRNSQGIRLALSKNYPRNVVAERVGTDRLLREVVAHTAAMFGGKSHFPSPATMAFCWRLCAKIDKSAAEDFFEAVAAGTGLRAADPAYVLRDRLLGLRGRVAHGERAAMVYYILRAFDAHLNDESLSRLRLTEVAESVEFPPVQRR